MDCVTSKVKLFVLPLAIVTIIVSPIALDIAKTIEAIIPEIALGIIIFIITSNRVDPIARAPSRKWFGTERIASSDKEAIIGVIITPITIPGLRIFVASSSGSKNFNIGVTNVKAKKPYTIVGMPANNSKIGLQISLTLF